MSEITENNQESKLCWFCGKNTAEEKYTLKQDMYKLLKRKGSYILVGISIKTSYLSKIINIPRCKYCDKTHSKIASITILVYLVLYAIFIWQVIIPDEATKGDKLVNAVLFLIMGFPLCGLIFWIVDKISGVKENKIENFPEIAELIANGWSIYQPNLKGEDTNYEK